MVHGWWICKASEKYQPLGAQPYRKLRALYPCLSHAPFFFERIAKTKKETPTAARKLRQRKLCEQARRVSRTLRNMSDLSDGLSCRRGFCLVGKTVNQIRQQARRSLDSVSISLARNLSLALSRVLF